MITENEKDKFDALMFSQGRKCADCGAEHGQNKTLLTMNKFQRSFALYCQSCAFKLVSKMQGQEKGNYDNGSARRKEKQLEEFGLKQESLL